MARRPLQHARSRATLKSSGCLRPPGPIASPISLMSDRRAGADEPFAGDTAPSRAEATSGLGWRGICGPKMPLEWTGRYHSRPLSRRRSARGSLATMSGRKKSPVAKGFVTEWKRQTLCSVTSSAIVTGCDCAPHVDAAKGASPMSGRERCTVRAAAGRPPAANDQSHRRVPTGSATPPPVQDRAGGPWTACHPCHAPNSASA